MPDQPLQHAARNACRRGLLLSLVLLAVCLSLCACDQANHGVFKMELSPLTDQERQSLADIKRFNQSQGKSGWVLADRKVPAEEVKLAGIELHKASLTNVDLSRVDMSKAHLSDCVLTRVQLSGTNLQDAVLENVELVDCEISGMKAGRTVFKACTFRASRGEQADFEAAQIEDCTFEGLTAKGFRFKGASLKRSVIRRSNLKLCTFYNNAIQKLEFADADIEGGTWSAIQGQDLLFKGGKLRDSGIDGATFTKLRLEGVDISGVTFDTYTARNLVFANCPTIEALTFLSCTLTDVSFTACPLVRKLVFLKSEINGLKMTDVRVGFVEFIDTAIAGESVLEAVNSTNTSFARARLTGVKFNKCVFDAVLSVKSSTFNNVKLVGVRYGKGLQLRNENNKYVESDEIGR